MTSGRKEEKKSSSAKLIVVLVILVLIIIGLVVGIVLVQVNKGSNEPSDENEIDYSMTTEKEVVAFNEFIDKYEEIMTKADELYIREYVTAEEILNLYGPTIDNYLSQKDFTNAQTFILLRNDDLISRGYEREAMNALVAIDYSIFPEASQNRYYHRIINLAKQLGETEIVDKYQVLADETEAAAEAYKKATADFAEKMRAGIEKKVNQE